jgi:radical SAM superfamily enzyme YgiQ (UPF0313 family)
LISLYDRTCFGVRYLAAVARQAGHEPFLIFLGKYEAILKEEITELPEDELNVGISKRGELVVGYQRPFGRGDFELLGELLFRLRPDIIGISLTSKYFHAARRVTEEIKRDFHQPVIWGGIEPTLEPERCLQHADIVCVGEGEGAIVDLLNLLPKGLGACSDIPNLWIKKNGEIHRNPPRPLIGDLDEIPFPLHDPSIQFAIAEGRLIERASFISNPDEGTYEVITSRGCPFSCTYCVNEFLHNLYPHERRVRRRSVDNVIEELKFAKEKLGIRYLNFQDDIFTLDRRWILDFAPRYRTEIGVPFWCYVHPNCVFPDALRALKESGLDYVTMGLQSGSPRILEVFDRRHSPERVIEAARTLKGLGIPFSLDVITNNPFEEEEDCRLTLEALLEMPRPLNLGGVLPILSFFPNYEITHRLEREGISPHVDLKRYRFWNSLYLLTELESVPTELIRALSRSIALREDPSPLEAFLRRQAALEEQSKRLREIQSSRGWKLLNAFYRIRGKLRK